MAANQSRREQTPARDRLAYIAQQPWVALDRAYFIRGTGKPDASKACGIMALNADTGETSELVKPEHGLWLSAPHWWPDGNLLGSVEQTQYEGSTPFGVQVPENPFPKGG